MTADLILWDWERNAAGRCRAVRGRAQRLLRRYGYPQQYDLDTYRDIFGFPVEEYYVRAGFDFSRHPFPVLAESYMQDYLPIRPPARWRRGPEKRWMLSAPPGCARWSCRPRRPTRWRTR